MKAGWHLVCDLELLPLPSRCWYFRTVARHSARTMSLNLGLPTCAMSSATLSHLQTSTRASVQPGFGLGEGLVEGCPWPAWGPPWPLCPILTFLIDPLVNSPPILPLLKQLWSGQMIHAFLQLSLSSCGFSLSPGHFNLVECSSVSTDYSTLTFVPRSQGL